MRNLILSSLVVVPQICCLNFDLIVSNHTSNFMIYLEIWLALGLSPKSDEYEYMRVIKTYIAFMNG